VKPLADSLLDALDYDSSDDSDFEVGDASGKLSQNNFTVILMHLLGIIQMSKSGIVDQLDL